MKKKFLSILMMIALVVMMLAGCSGGSTGSTEETTEGGDEYTVRIPISASLCSAPMQLAVINGYFDEVGLNWEPVDLGDSSSLDLVATGKADVSYDLLLTLVERIASGMDYGIVAGAHYGCINVVASPESGIESVEDLKGKRIGCPVSLGSDPTVLLMRVLTKAGIGCTTDNMEVDLQVFQNSDLEAALTGGQIDAFVSWDPYASLVAKTHDYPIVFSQTDSEMTKDEYCCFLGFTNEFIDEHPEEVAKVCEAVEMACKFIEENPEEAVKLTTENNYVALDDLELGAELLKSYRYGLNVEGGKTSFQNCTQDLLDLEIIELNQSVEDFVKDHYRAVEGVNY